MHLRYGYKTTAEVEEKMEVLMLGTLSKLVNLYSAWISTVMMV